MTLLKPYKNKELAALYNVSYHSFLRMMKLVKKKITDLGQPMSGYWSTNQVQKIVEHLGPFQKEIND